MALALAFGAARPSCLPCVSLRDAGAIFRLAQNQRRQAQESNNADHVSHRGQHHAAGDCGIDSDLAQHDRNHRARERTGEQVDPNDPNLENYFGGANIFFVYELDERTTRLIIRQRLGWSPSLLMTLIYRAFLEPISFVMARKTLLGIKQRAEAA